MPHSVSMVAMDAALDARAPQLVPLALPVLSWCLTAAALGALAAAYWRAPQLPQHRLRLFKAARTGVFALLTVAQACIVAVAAVFNQPQPAADTDYAYLLATESAALAALLAMTVSVHCL